MRLPYLTILLNFCDFPIWLFFSLLVIFNYVCVPIVLYVHMYF